MQLIPDELFPKIYIISTLLTAANTSAATISIQAMQLKSTVK